MACALHVSAYGQASNAKSAAPYRNIEVHQRNRLQPHVNVIPYGDSAEVLNAIAALGYRQSPWYLTLNGSWKFRLCKSTDNMPAYWSSIDHDLSRWTDIAVPGGWEQQGYTTGDGNTPCRIPLRQPRGGDTLATLADTLSALHIAVGCYVRDFELPQQWAGRRTVIRFGAVSSAFHLYVNGRQVGYSEDSRTPAEFDITRYLQPGVNRLMAKVYSFSDGSLLECRDFWGMSGLLRDVALYSTPSPLYINDFRVTAALDTADYSRGLFSASVELPREVGATAVGVELELFDGSVSLLRRRRTLVGSDFFVIFPARENIIADVKPWSADSPHLYTVVIRLVDTADSVLQTVGCRAGFRNVQMVGGVMQLNGKAVTLRGVSRQEHSPFGGRYVTRDEMQRAVRTLKAEGFNAVRTANGPNDEYWYELCDSEGIYVWDEANVDLHTDSTALLDAVLFRVNNMFKRDRNHPCIIAWSLGNSCDCFGGRVYRSLKARDISRPVTCAGGGLNSCNDIINPLYHLSFGH
ncbi:MAG: hypothetical protein J6X62_05090 [Bacteroidales bacterium]|nr:hypothetical protein [Bacteroidales bacterium]